MARKRNHKVGERIFFEIYQQDGTIGVESGIVQKITESSYTNDYGKEIPFKYLWIDKMTTVEDYLVVPISDPRAKELSKHFERVDEIAKVLEQWITDNYDQSEKNEVLKALEQVYHNLN